MSKLIFENKEGFRDCVGVWGGSFQTKVSMLKMQLWEAVSSEGLFLPQKHTFVSV